MTLLGEREVNEGFSRLACRTTEPWWVQDRVTVRG
jgi:hypothetical protein